jgi:hypothetical protein
VEPESHVLEQNHLQIGEESRAYNIHIYARSTLLTNLVYTKGPKVNVQYCTVEQCECNRQN